MLLNLVLDGRFNRDPHFQRVMASRRGRYAAGSSRFNRDPHFQRVMVGLTMHPEALNTPASIGTLIFRG